MRFPPFSGTSICERMPSHWRTSPFTRAAYVTSATEVEVTTYNNLYAVNPQNAEVGVWVDGEWYHSIYPENEGLHVEMVGLPTGEKLVELIGGSQIIDVSGGDPFGTWVSRASFSGPCVMQADEGVQIAAYGDSITMGGQASPRLKNAWVMRVRANGFPKTAIEGYGGNSLYVDSTDGPGLETVAARIASHNADAVWIAIGTNDYYGGFWSPAEFGEAYGSLLDGIHQGSPTSRIFAQSPITRAVESGNSLGFSLSDYRVAISDCCVARPWAMYVEGGAILSVSDLSPGGVHPTTEGHAIYANFVINALAD